MTAFFYFPPESSSRKCVNDATYSLNYVILLILRLLNFVAQLFITSLRKEKKSTPKKLGHGSQKQTNVMIMASTVLEFNTPDGFRKRRPKLSG